MEFRTKAKHQTRGCEADFKMDTGLKAEAHDIASNGGALVVKERKWCMRQSPPPKDQFGNESNGQTKSQGSARCLHLPRHMGTATCIYYATWIGSWHWLLASNRLKVKNSNWMFNAHEIWFKPMKWIWCTSSPLSIKKIKPTLFPPSRRQPSPVAETHLNSK